MNSYARRFFSMLVGVTMLGALGLVGTATAQAAVLAPITPAPVTFDGCDVIVPETPNVTYFVSLDYVDLGPTVNKIEAGKHSHVDFQTAVDIVFYAEANDGYSLADNAVTQWAYPEYECTHDPVDDDPVDDDHPTVAPVAGV